MALAKDSVHPPMPLWACIPYCKCKRLLDSQFEKRWIVILSKLDIVSMDLGEFDRSLNI